ncbi:MAG TPA: hypothetical protein VEP90_10875 [Methylomirabilota bacterium]|nr:hypothetical protein [Methylomirabilota bacterium]
MEASIKAQGSNFETPAETGEILFVNKKYKKPKVPAKLGSRSDLSKTRTEKELQDLFDDKSIC